MNMRKTTLIAAGAAAALSFGLIPAATAAAGEHVAGRASCAGGGTIRVGGTVDADGNATAVAHVWDADRDHWTGTVIAGLDDDSFDAVSDEDAEDMVHHYTAQDGDLTIVAKQTGATTPDAMAMIMTPGMRRVCLAAIAHEGKQYVTMGMLEGLAVASGERQAVAAFAMGEENHTYRARFTLTGRAGTVQTRIKQQTVKKGELGLNLTVRDFKRVSSFKRVTVRIVDLTNKKAKPASYAIVR